MEPMPAGTAAAVAWWFDLGAVSSDLVLAARGEQGRVWRLETSRGRWAVKELLSSAPETDAARDVEFQLAARSAGIPLPQPQLTREGRVMLPAGQAGIGRDIRLYQWADLAPGEVVTPAEIGAVAARLHQLPPGSDPGPIEAWFTEPLGELAWAALLDDARRADAPWAGPLDRWLPDLITMDSAISPPDPTGARTCHRDLNTENICRTAAGGVIVLDWENSGPAQPERELAALITDLAADLGPGAAQAAHSAYQASGGPAGLTTIADFAMAAAIQGHLLQFYSGRALDPAEPAENKTRARTRLHHMLRQPLTLAQASNLLDLTIQGRRVDHL